MAKTATMTLDKALNSKTLGLIDMDSELAQLTYALLTKEHLFIEGEPGTAKSMMAKRAFNAIEGADTFSIHMSKETTDDTLFGPISIKELRENENYIRITDKSILSADLAFIDEMFDASEDTLRTLLTVLNERKWIRGNQQVTAKLHTAIATANYKSINDKTKAVLDRFIFKAKSKSKMSRNNEIKMYQSFLSEDKTIDFDCKKKFKFSELQAMAEKVIDNKSITIPETLVDVYYDLIHEFETESKKFISLRARTVALKVVKASALLNDRDTCDIDDLKATKYVFCTLNEGEEESLFDVAYSKAVAIIKIREDLEDTVKFATDILKKKTDTMSMSDFVKHIKDAQLLNTKFDNVTNSTVKLDTDTKKSIDETRTKLKAKVMSMQKELSDMRDTIK